MFGILKRLFGGSQQPEPPDDSLAALSRDLARAAAFIEQLAQGHVWILAIGQNATLESGTLSEDALRDHIERNAKELSDLSDSDAIVPFIMQRGASSVLPFFSSLEFAEHFVRTERWQTTTAFQTLQLRSGFITSPELADCQLILNLNSKSPRTITDRERESLRQQTANA